MTKQFLVIPFLLLQSFILKSQNFTVTEVTDKLSPRVGNGYFSKADNGDFFNLSYEGGARIAPFGIGAKSAISGDFVIRKFGPDLKEKQSSTIKFEKVDYDKGLLELELINNRLYFFYVQKGAEGISNIQVVELDTSSLMPIKETTIANFEFEGSHSITLNASPNKKFLLFTLRSYKKKTEVYNLIVINDNAEINRTINYELDESRFLYQAVVDNNGEVYTVMADKIDDDTKNYSIQIYSDIKKTPSKKIKIDFGEKHPMEFNFYRSRLGSEFYFMGSYKNKSEGNCTGVYMTDLSNQTKLTIKPVLKDFDPELLAALDVDGLAKKDGKNIGLENGFWTKRILTRQDSSIDYLLEYNKMIRGEKATFFNSGSVIDVHYANNEINFVRIPKLQSYASTNAYLSCHPFIYGDNLVLLYNERDDNIERSLKESPKVMGTPKNSVLVAAVVNKDNGVTRKIIWDNGDGKYAAEFFINLNGNKVLIIQSKVGVGGFAYRLGMMNVE